MNAIIFYADGRTQTIALSVQQETDRTILTLPKRYITNDTDHVDFAPEHLDEAIRLYHQRNRRFGGV